MQNHVVIELMKTYFDDRKVDEFHVELFAGSSGTPILPPKLALGSPDDNITSFYGRCIIQLPIQQYLRIWSIFLDNQFWETPMSFELFAIFLEHLRYDVAYPKTVQAKIDSLFDCTQKKLAELNILEHSSLAACLRFLVALGQLILARDYYEDKNTVKFNGVVKWYDVTCVHDSSSPKMWRKIFHTIGHDDQKQTFYLLRILHQKMIMLQRHGFLNIGLRDEIQESIERTMIHVLQTSSSRWSIIKHHQDYLFQLLPLVKSIVIYEFTDSVVGDAFLSAQNELFLPSKIQFKTGDDLLASALIDSLVRELAKIFTNNPMKGRFGEILEEFFTLLSDDRQFWFETCQQKKIDDKKRSLFVQLSFLLNDLEASDQTDIEPTLAILVSFLEMLPLEYLQPYSQVRVAYLLMAWILGAVTRKSTEKFKLRVVDCLNRLFSSVRSLWFLDFFTPVQIIAKLFSHLEDDIIPSIERAIYWQKNHTWIEKIKIQIQLMLNRILKPGRFSASWLKSLSDYFSSREEVGMLGAWLLAITIETMVQCDEKRKNDELDTLATVTIEKLVNYLVGCKNEQYLLVCIELLAREKHHVSYLPDGVVENLRKLVKKWWKPLLNTGDRSAFSVESLRFLVALSSANLECLAPRKFRSKLWNLLFDDIGGNDNSMEIEKAEFNGFSIEIDNLLDKLFTNFVDGADEEEIEWQINFVNVQLCSDVVTKLQGGLCFRVLNAFFSHKSSSRKMRWLEQSGNFERSVMSMIKLSMEADDPDGWLFKGQIAVLHSALKNCSSLFTAQKISLIVQSLLATRIELFEKPEAFSMALCSLLTLVKDLFFLYPILIQPSRLAINSLVHQIFGLLCKRCSIESMKNASDSHHFALGQAASSLTRILNKIIELAKAEPGKCDNLVNLVYLYVDCDSRSTIHPKFKEIFTPSVYKILSRLPQTSSKFVHSQLTDNKKPLFNDIYENYQRYYLRKGRL